MDGIGKLVSTAVTGMVMVTLATLPHLLSSFQHAAQGSRDPAPAPLAPPPSGPPHATEPTDWTLPVTIIAVVIAVIIVCAAGAVIWWVAAHRRTAKRERAARREQQIRHWNRGAELFAQTAQSLTAYETDAESVYFSRPLLADVDEPKTAAFYEAFAHVSSLYRDTVPDDADTITAFITAARAAARAFGLADENARRKARMGITHGDRRLTPAERRKVDQAEKLMAQAHDPSSIPEFAHTAHTKARSLLDEVGVVIPERLVSNVIRSLEAAHRPALTAG